MVLIANMLFFHCNAAAAAQQDDGDKNRIDVSDAKSANARQSLRDDADTLKATKKRCVHNSFYHYSIIAYTST
jgi:hypothetical protein